MSVARTVAARHFHIGGPCSRIARSPDILRGDTVLWAFTFLAIASHPRVIVYLSVWSQTCYRLSFNNIIIVGFFNNLTGVVLLIIIIIIIGSTTRCDIDFYANPIISINFKLRCNRALSRRA